MWNRHIVVMAGVSVSLLLCSPLHAADQPSGQTPAHADEGKIPDGVIGISLHIGADRVGDPASLYVGKVHREGPAHAAGLRHGDELVSVNGVPASGKTYEHVVKMVRSEAGTTVKLGVKREGEGSLREISISRVTGDKLMKGPADHGTYKEKP